MHAHIHSVLMEAPMHQPQHTRLHKSLVLQPACVAWQSFSILIKATPCTSQCNVSAQPLTSPETCGVTEPRHIRGGLRSTFK